MKRYKNPITVLVLTVGALAMPLGGCSSAKTILAVDSGNDRNTGPINNPFGDYYANAKPEPSDPIILRTKKGDRSVEVELPREEQAMTDFVIPVSPAFKEGISTRGPASVGGQGGGASGLDDTYKDQEPSLSDREIMASMPQGAAEDESARREIESGLGLMPSEDATPVRDKSYLASMDHIKQLYRGGRFEAALIEVDSMIRLYQTDAKLYEMRGTLLDRLGKKDLSLKAWNQSLRFDPNNVALRKFLEKRQNRSLASP